MDGETATQIVEMVLEFLAQAASAVVEVGFAISVKYVVADAVSGLAKFFVSVLGVVIGILVARKSIIAMDKEKNYNEEWEGSKIAISLILATVFLIMAVFSNPFESIKMLLAPEWYAITNVIDLVVK